MVKRTLATRVLICVTIILCLQACKISSNQTYNETLENIDQEKRIEKPVNESTSSQLDNSTVVDDTQSDTSSNTTNNAATVDDKFLFYVKDGEMYCYNTEEHEIAQITSGFSDGLSNNEIAGRGHYCLISKDKSTLLYSNAAGKSHAWYVCKLNNPINSAVKLTEHGYDGQRLSDDGKTVYYAGHDEEEKGVYYYDSENNTKMFLKNDDMDELFVSKDGKTIIFQKGNAIFIKEEGSEIKQLFSAKEIYNCYCWENDSIKMYIYAQKNDSNDGCILFYEKGKGIYEYKSKVNYSRLTFFNNGTGYYFDDSCLYYFDENSTKKVSADVMYVLFDEMGSIKPIVSFESLTGRVYIAVEENVYYCGDNLEFIGFNNELTEAYYVSKDNTGQEKDIENGLYNIGSLYKYEIIGSEIKCHKLSDSVVTDGKLKPVVINNDILYFVNKFEDNKLTMSVNNIEVDTVSNNCKLLKDSIYLYPYYGRIYYYSEYDSENQSGCLRMYENGKSVKISEGVTNSTITPEGNLLFLKNYNFVKSLGELYYYNDQIHKIDDDIIAIQNCWRSDVYNGANASIANRID